MSRGLPEPVRKYLNAMDSRLEALDGDDRAELLRQATLTLQMYQGLPMLSLARLIMEPVVAMDGALARAKQGEDLETEVRQFMYNGALLAALLTRQSRGRPPL